ncbi:MAG: 6-carboxytetrahydropterin synthase QueD [Eubacteriales bacterium]|nr:6-carboxytetrahydropterin synthase QueD [Eubacteriales bacterium]
MFFLETEQSFDSAHFLKDYDGKCHNIHGHRWRVIARASAEHLSTNRQTRGMVMDFGDLKKSLKELADYFDHALIIEAGSLKSKTLEALEEESFRIVEVAFRPTAELFARYFYEQLRERSIPVCSVSVYETPSNCATYQEV